MKKIVVGFGELLWDMLPQGRQIGGAPGNFAYHAMQCGLDGYIVSAVGKDPLGKEILQVADRRGINCLVSCVEHPTGTVDVQLNALGVPQYTINEGVAWDYIPFSKELRALAPKADGICFGSLAQRNKVSRNTLHQFLSYAQPDALRIFDINLRQHFYSQQLIKDSLALCNILKLNEEEAVILGKMLGYTTSERVAISKQILSSFHLKMVILTCGSDCSYVFTPAEESYLKTPSVKIADTVGAGDSFTAAFCSCIMQGKSIREAHAAAVEIAAFVCTQNGAMPAWTSELKTKYTQS